MLRSVFDVDRDCMRMRGTGVDGPTYLVALVALLLVAAVATAVAGSALAWSLADRAALAIAGVAMLVLVVAAASWPRSMVVVDRANRQLTLARGTATGQRIPLEKVRFEITPVRHWRHRTLQPCWAFVAKVPGESAVQLYLSVSPDRVKQLWQELGEWLAGGNR